MKTTEWNRHQVMVVDQRDASIDGGEVDGLLDALRLIAPDAQVLVVSNKDDIRALLGPARPGASAFIPRYAGPAEGPNTLRAVAGARYYELTRRERETLNWLSRALTAREIGERMHVSRRTVERHLANAYKKLGTHNKADAIHEFNRILELAS